MKTLREFLDKVEERGTLWTTWLDDLHAIEAEGLARRRDEPAGDARALRETVGFWLKFWTVGQPQMDVDWQRSENQRYLKAADNLIEMIAAALPPPAREHLAALENELPVRAAQVDHLTRELTEARESLRDLLGCIADEDTGDGRGELIRDTSRDDAPDYLQRMMRLVQILARAQRAASPPAR